MTKEDNKGPEKVVYPCRWHYKVIGPDREKLAAALQEYAGSRAGAVSPSRSSSGGKYHSFNLAVSVASEEERNAIYQAIKNHPHVTMVL